MDLSISENDHDTKNFFNWFSEKQGEEQVPIE